MGRQHGATQVPDAPGLELIANQLRKQVPDCVVDTSFYHQQASIEVKPEAIVPVLTALRDDPQQAYDFLSSVHGCDYYPQEPRFGVHYELLNMERAERLRVKLRVPLEAPEVDTVMGLFPTANFQEREIYDMFGVVFKGHPDLRRILMPEDYEGYPQRRDFPIGGEPVIFTHNEPASPGWFK